jgi:nucleotide-binding universal stress UspA family protein
MIDRRAEKRKRALGHLLRTIAQGSAKWARAFRGSSRPAARRGAALRRGEDRWHGTYRAVSCVERGRARSDAGADVIALETVLVATDFGEPAAVALTYGRGLARTFAATLHLVHVVDDVMGRATTSTGFTFDFGRMQADVEAGARASADALLSDEDRRDLHAKTVILTSTTPALSIVQYARDARANLIIVGTHGRGGVAHLFLGSVAERIVRMAPCPVLTVRQPEHEFVLPDALQRLPQP